MNGATPLTTSSDDELAVRVQTKDGEAFCILRERYQPQLFGWLVRQVGQDGAEDLGQELWLRVWRSIDRYDCRNQFRGWVFQIARNLVLDRQRKRTVRGYGGNDDDVDAIQDVAHKDADPLAVLLQAEEQQHFRECLEKLDARARKIVVDRSRDVPYEKLVAELQISLGAAHKVFFNAKIALNRCVEGKQV